MNEFGNYNIEQQNMAQQGIAQQGMAQQGMAQQNMAQQNIAQQGMVQQNMVQQGIAQQSVEQQNIEMLADEDINESKDAVSRSKMGLFDWVQCFVGAVIIGIVIFIFVGRTISVDGISMMNTLYNGDRVIMSNLFYTPGNGDIIVFQNRSDDFYGAPFVKRVIATENQVVDINFENGNVYVDGLLQCEPFINEPTHVRNQFEGPLTVPTGHVFVMGDNRNFSSDSRDSRVGMVDTRQILGRVLFLVVPGGTHQDWSRFGLIESIAICPPNRGCVCDV